LFTYGFRKFISNVNVLTFERKISKVLCQNKISISIYALSVLWMTSRFPTIGPVGRNQTHDVMFRRSSPGGSTSWTDVRLIPLRCALLGGVHRGRSLLSMLSQLSVLVLRDHHLDPQKWTRLNWTELGSSSVQFVRMRWDEMRWDERSDCCLRWAFKIHILT